jgi:hypothetical protein
MARPLRIDIQDGLYHVTSRGWERRDVVRDERDRQRWLQLLVESQDLTPVLCRRPLKP